MTTPISITLTPYTVIWRYQGDVIDGLLSNTTLTLFLQTAYKDENGQVFKTEPLPPISGTPAELGLADEFAALQSKINDLIVQMNAPS